MPAEMTSEIGTGFDQLLTATVQQSRRRKERVKTGIVLVDVLRQGRIVITAGMGTTRYATAVLR